LLHGVPFASEKNCHFVALALPVRQLPESHFHSEHIFHDEQTDGAPVLHTHTPAISFATKAPNLRRHTLFIGAEFPVQLATDTAEHHGLVYFHPKTQNFSRIPVTSNL